MDVFSVHTRYWYCSACKAIQPNISYLQRPTKSPSDQCTPPHTLRGIVIGHLDQRSMHGPHPNLYGSFHLSLPPNHDTSTRDSGSGGVKRTTESDGLLGPRLVCPFPPLPRFAQL